jgi:flagellar biosynthesis component FlhA
MATRRLPVIQEPAGEDAEAAARPPWQWVLIGSGLLVTIWTPSVAVSLAIARKISEVRGDAAVGPGIAAVLVALSFALSALAAGYLVARFGPRTSLRHSTFAGLVAAAEIWVLALMGGAFSSAVVGVSALLSLSALASAFCVLGAWLRRRRKLKA